jgi:hypothetical protein
MRGNSNLFGEDVNLGLLLQFPKDQELWVVEGENMVNFVAQIGLSIFLVDWLIEFIILLFLFS